MYIRFGSLFLRYRSHTKHTCCVKELDEFYIEGYENRTGADIAYQWYQLLLTPTRRSVSERIKRANTSYFGHRWLHSYLFIYFNNLFPVVWTMLVMAPSFCHLDYVTSSLLTLHWEYDLSLAARTLILTLDDFSYKRSSFFLNGMSHFRQDDEHVCIYRRVTRYQKV